MAEHSAHSGHAGELREARTELERAERENRTKDDFLATLAHELRNPLNAVRSGVRVLEQLQPSTDASIRAHAVIAQELSHLSHLIEDLLDVERSASGKVRLNRRALDLAAAVHRAVGPLMADSEIARRLTLDIQPTWVDGDGDRLQQVLTNIINNAVKYTPLDGRIGIALRGDGRNAVLTVADTGDGIAADLLPVVFDMFVQGASTLDRAQGGLGIGLTLVRRLVELHGGDVTVASPGVGKGSTFTVRLPQVAAPAPVAIASHMPTGATSPRSILVIEDSRESRTMSRMMLELDGHRVFEAADGLSGLQILETERPDAALIDIGLPGIDGYEVARRIRRQPYGRTLLLVAITGYDLASDCTRSAAAGFDHHLTKPVDPAALAKMLNELSQAQCDTAGS